MTDEELIAALNSKAEALGIEITIKPQSSAAIDISAK